MGRVFLPAAEINPLHLDLRVTDIIWRYIIVMAHIKWMNDEIESFQRCQSNEWHNHTNRINNSQNTASNKHTHVIVSPSKLDDCEVFSSFVIWFM